MKQFNFIILSMCLVISMNLNAGGNDFISTKNSKTMALNGIYLAGIDGVLGSRFNPATLSSLNGYGFEFTALDKLGDQTIIGSNNDNSYSSFRNDDILITAGVFAKLNENFAIGISYAPELSYSVDWPYTQLNSKESASLVTAYDLKNSISINALSPMLSYKTGPLAFGITANIYFAEINYTYPKINSDWLENIGLPGYELAFKLDGWEYGFGASVIYDFSQDLSLTMAFQSGSEINLEGNLESNLFSEVYDLPSDISIESKWENPSRISIGGLYKINNKIALNVDFSMDTYGNSEEILNHNIESSIISEELSTSDSLLGLSGNFLETNFNNSIHAGIGLEYVSSELLTYRASYRLSQSSQNESMFSHLFANVDQHWFALGLGITQSSFLIDIALIYAFGNQLIDVEKSVFEGEYSSQLFIPSITIKYSL